MSKLFELEYEDILSPKTMKTLKGKSAASLKQMLGNKTLTNTMMRSKKVLDDIIEAEEGYRDELEMVAIQMVTDAYPIIDYANIKIEAKIVGMSELNIQSPPPEEDPALPSFGSDDEEKAKAKRRIINGITQGASIRGAFGFTLFKEYLDNIDDTLVGKYNEILKLVFGIYDDENAIAMLLAALAQGQSMQGGESEMEYDEDNNQFVVKAKAICFPMLVHEIVKGLYEIVGTEGFSSNKDKNQAIIGAVDKVSNEPHDLQMGKFIYDSISKIYNESDIEDARVRELFFAELYKSEDGEFIPFIENAINDALTQDQKQWASGIMKDIESDLKKDDTGLQGLDESLKIGKQYFDQGKISASDLKQIIDIDPSPTKKFVGWMSKVWITEKPTLSNLINTITEYNVFLNKGKAKTKDINSFKSFEELKKEVDQLNQTGDGMSVKDLENDYEILRNDDDILAISPHTHEASRKVGIAYFAYRDCEDGKKDSAWCTTFKAPDNFNHKYHEEGYTFVYVRVKSEHLMAKLKAAFPKKYKEYVVMALYFTPEGNVRAQDGLDNELSRADAKQFINIIGIK